MKDAAAKPFRRDRTVWGLVLIAAGLALLLDRTGQIELRDLWRYWPVLLVIAGLSNMVPPTTPRLVMSGLSCIGFAAWFYISMEHLWGLSFHNSWPLLIVLWGVKLVVRPMLEKRFGDGI